MPGTERDIELAAAKLMEDELNDDTVIIKTKKEDVVFSVHQKKILDWVEHYYNHFMTTGELVPLGSPLPAAATAKRN